MLYDNYRKKMTKLKNALDVVKRFRVLIIIICAALLALIVTLMSVSGMVYDKTDCPAQLTYGEDLDYRAKAVFKSVRYEYAQENSDEWTDKKPVCAGSYKVRPVSKSVFGNSRYGKTHSFRILPRKTDIYAAEQAVFGDSPQVFTDLAFSDTAVCTAFDYEDITAKTTNVIPELSGVKITDKNGNDVTSSYVLNPVQTQITFLPRPVIITADSAQKEYDGTPLTCATYTADNLAAGHTLSARTGGVKTTAGTAFNAIEDGSVKIISADGKDVTDNYDITLVAGVLTVDKRQITVNTQGGEWTYDGTAHENLSFSVYDGTLVSGHSFSVQSLPKITDAGEKKNTIALGIYSGGENLSENYEIKYNFGTLKVTPRKVTVNTQGGEWTYDGTAHSQTGHTVAGLVSGHTTVVVKAPSITDVGSTENTLKIAVFDGNRDITDNYEILYDLGTLTVSRRKLTITAQNSEFVYDGTPHKSVAYSAENLVAGHSVQAVSSVSLTQAGTVKNSLTANIYLGGKDVTANYAVTYVEGTLTVTPRPITLSAGSILVEYDGKAHAYEKFEVTSALAPALVSGHKLNATTQGFQTEVGTGANKIVADSISVTDASGNPVTENYSITVKDGEIQVAARIITVKAGDDAKVYDGTPLTCATYTDKDGKLLTGHKLSATTSGSRTEAGKSANTIVEGSVKITSASGDDVTHNYSVKTESGTLEINPRPIKITIGSAEKVYDGKPLSCNEFTITSDYSPALVLSHKAKGTSMKEITEVGKVKNAVSVKIFDGETEVTENYKMEYTDGGTLTITPRPITVTTKGGEWVYDGQPHYNTDIVISGDGLADGQYYSAYSFTIVKGAEEAENRVYIRIYAEDEKQTTDNYDITYAKPYGVLKVSKRPLTVTSCSAEKVYDGTPLTCSDAVADDLVKGQVLTVQTVGSQTDVGSSYNYISSVHITADDSGISIDVTANYEIKTLHGTLTVTPRKVTVYAMSASKVYDGAPLICRKYGWDNVVYTHTVKADVSGEQINVGSSLNKISGVGIYDGSRNVTSNYAITALDGTLTVSQGTLIIFTGSAQKEYDGTPLTCPLYYIDENSVIPDGFTYTVNVTGTITQVGSTANKAEITVFDADGNDVTENIGIEKQFGTLLITGDGVGGGGSGSGSGSGGGLAADGGIGSGGSEGGMGSSGSTGDNFSKPEVIMMKIYSDASGSAYMRYKSFGDYDGRKWSEAQAYTQLLSGGYSANYLTSLALENSGMQSHTMQILPFTYDYTLPYYTASADGNYDVQLSDTVYNGNTGAQYYLNYFLYDYASQGVSYAVPEQYGQYEQAYRQFVYENYLGVKTSTLEYLNTVITAQRFNKNDKQIVSKVARYVRNAAKYNLYYNSALDKSEDIVVAFLRDYRQGTCSHYASAATLLYRALGIPARYTIGYSGQTVANAWSYVTEKQAHAWVEVYIDGMGWVQVEVTGGSSGGNHGGEGDIGGGGSIEGIVNDYTIVLRPQNEAKAYDGTPVYAKEIVPDAVLEKLLDMGYTYSVTFSGELSSIGSAVSEVASFTLYDEYGNDVTGKFSYKYKQGKLTVANKVATVCLYNLSKEYDGTPLKYSSGEYYTPGLPLGYAVLFDSAGIGGTEAGVIYADDLGKANVYVMNEYGANVTSEYYVHFQGALVITQRTVKLTANSDEKKYDGLPLTNSGFFISGGSLAEGHSVQATVDGSVTDIGSSENTVSKATFYDVNGKDVTLNYFCLKTNGTLTVISD